MQIADIWLRDMPQQFQGKHNIEVLIKAFSKQMQELEKVFHDINILTDIDKATGKNLDYVGTIIPLSRKEAGEIVNQRFREPVISDLRYRQYLQYKMLVNTSECTYYDIMKAIEILWDINKAHYYERADRPATIFIGLPTVDVEEDDQAKGKPSIMKPAGVGFFYTAQYSIIMDQSDLEKVKVVYVDVHTYFYFFKRILNGDWILDGSVSLGQIPIAEIAVVIALGTIRVVHKGRPCLHMIDISQVFHAALPCSICSVEIVFRFDSSKNIPKADIDRICVNIPLPCTGMVEAESVTVKKDLWHLDGQVLMDGSRILDAEVREERL